jgi:hypothetical protein
VIAMIEFYNQNSDHLSNCQLLKEDSEPWKRYVHLFMKTVPYWDFLVFGLHPSSTIY